MGGLVSHSISIASASRVREGILIALGSRFSNSGLCDQSARAWLTGCFQRYDDNGSGQIPCNAVLNVVAEMTLFRIHEWSANEVSQFCAFFFRGEEGEQNFDYQLFLDYIFFPVTENSPQIKLKSQFGGDDVFDIHKGELLPPAFGPEASGEHGRPVIIKRLDLAKLSTEAERFPQFGGAEELVVQLRHRVNELRLLTHPNLVAFQTTLQHQTSLYVIQEQHEVCSLRTILESFGPMKESTIRRYLLQVLQAFSFLHDHGVHHGNLTIQAVHIDSYGLLKIADFGLRRSLLPLVSKTTASEDDWTRKYLAPEVVRDCRLWGAKTDVWCIGILTLQMANGFPVNQFPQSFEPMSRKVSPRSNSFHDWSPTQSPNKNRGSELPETLSGVRLPSLPDSASKGLNDFIRACLQRDPRKRPPIKRLMEMRFFCIDQAKVANEVFSNGLGATTRQLKSSSPEFRFRK